jgi:hypothetical protein
MSNNEDKKEFIENPDSFDNSRSSIVKIWVLPECAPRAIKLKASLDKVEDLDDFALILTREIKDLEAVDPQKLVFLNNENIPYKPDTTLKSLITNNSAETPLIICYPISNVNRKYFYFRCFVFLASINIY